MTKNNAARKIQTIVWDFNGTILDDVGIGVEAANVLLAESGKPLIGSVEAYRKVFGFPVIDYYERIGLEREKFPTYAKKWVETYNALEPKAGLQDGVLELLTYFQTHGYTQYLLSATESGMLARQLGRLGIVGFFEKTIGQDNIHAHGKIQAAKAFSASVGLKNALVLGDSLHDAEVAEAIGADCVLFACGHEDAERLHGCGHPVFENARELQKAFENGEF